MPQVRHVMPAYPIICIFFLLIYYCNSQTHSCTYSIYIYIYICVCVYICIHALYIYIYIYIYIYMYILLFYTHTDTHRHTHTHTHTHTLVYIPSIRALNGLRRDGAWEHGVLQQRAAGEAALHEPPYVCLLMHVGAAQARTRERQE
jgi:hypothetical protein